MEKQKKEMHAFLRPRSSLLLHLIPEYSGINQGQRIHDRSKTAYRKPPLKCFLTVINLTLHCMIIVTRNYIDILVIE